MNEGPLDSRLVLAGPMPPPIHGQSVVMSQLVSELSSQFPRMRLVDTASAKGSVAAVLSTLSADTVYLAVKAEKGMWLTTIVAGLAKLAGARIFLHHHSYLYVEERKKRMVALARAAGPDAYHITLSHSMREDLQAVMPEISRVLTVNNSRWIDQSLLEIPPRTNGAELVLGHLSNLGPEKGIAEVVELAVTLRQAGTPARLILAGPAINKVSKMQVQRAAHELGEFFEYRGPLAGRSKHAFFADITHFVFPSRNEALPLVLYEAMASGAVCLTTRQGAIPEQLKGSPALLARSADSFVIEISPQLIGMSSSTTASQQSRSAFLRALSESDAQFAHLVKLIRGR